MGDSLSYLDNLLLSTVAILHYPKVLVMFGVSKRLSRSISLAVYCSSLHLFLADLHPL